ncbi:23S rRNA (uracil(1939)-C(5))-methyltransferase RlmD [Peptoniphilus sp. MSJ-1]|uniref:23S rRNA (Uracil(1939)-C(5))-methyltransferase RlmD n=1 Tax=Peptoniphilus ovalis TaxID=2841503 RepID=A0ABS6FGR9_9FIRM|nr:23S rRNA (uracil(1939)-C(5))-methyltransferase RlmD [Peptoniphilus ovalis]MBU5669380.1 23S rRNA (uracil(1939)-C(5))-methyltransferase RlmD [Peptoniphilus ovalis]
MAENNFIGEIVDFDFKGKGIVKLDGVPVFLDGGIIGDKVEFQITKKKKNFCNGKIIKIIKKSSKRVKSPCIYSKTCGGCDFLELDSEEELKWKVRDINNNLKKISGIDIEVSEIIQSEKLFEYRNNMQFQVKDGKIGLYEKNSRDITPIKKCLMQSKNANKVLEILWNFKHINKLKRIGIRTNYKDEVLLILVTKSEKVDIKSIIYELINSNVKSIYMNYNSGDKYHYSREFELIYGDQTLEEKLLDIKYEISPESFFQVNRLTTEKLYEKAIEYIEPKEEEKIYDLYCGVGSITLSVARYDAELIGIEIVEKAVEDARKNAENNNLEARFIAGASEDIIEKLKDEEKIYPDKIILDPPRKGLDESLANFLVENPVERIVYISCNPSTQARDLKILKEKYKIEKIAAVNLFPNTVHVETIAVLSKIQLDNHKTVEIEEDYISDINFSEVFTNN